MWPPSSGSKNQQNSAWYLLHAGFRLALCSFNMPVDFQQTIWHYTPENRTILDNGETIKSYLNSDCLNHDNAAVPQLQLLNFCKIKYITTIYSWYKMKCRFGLKKSKNSVFQNALKQITCNICREWSFQRPWVKHGHEPKLDKYCSGQIHSSELLRLCDSLFVGKSVILYHTMWCHIADDGSTLYSSLLIVICVRICGLLLIECCQ
jgi:hypothetical protein